MIFVDASFLIALLISTDHFHERALEISAAGGHNCLLIGSPGSGKTMISRRLPTILPDMTFEEVHDSLMEMGAQVLMKTIEELRAGTLKRVPQEGESNYAPMLTKETGHIDWQKSAQEIHNLVRGLNSWPGAYTAHEGQKFKIWRTVLTGETVTSGTTAGEILAADSSQGLKVATGDGQVLAITELQAPGKKKMQAQDYLRGNSLAAGSCFV